LRFAKLASLLAALILAACQSQPVVTPIASSQRLGAARGIDLPTDASDVFGELQGIKLDFVARYYRDPASRWPTLSPSEAQRLSSLGTKIVTVWEWHSGDPAYFTYATGYTDAVSAAQQAKTVGQPPGSAIYFAVDFNARGPALYQVDQYFRGVNAGLAAAGGGRRQYRIGVYGSGAVCAAMRGAGLAQYAWLSGSTAWEGTAGYDGWNIRQAAEGARFANLSFSHDANEARNDYGGFQLANYANAATPAGAIVSAAAAAPAAAAAVVSGALAAIEPPLASPRPAPPMAPAAPTATTVVAAMTPIAPATARVAPASRGTPNPSAAELAAAEPAIAAAPAVPLVTAAARTAVEPEKPRAREQLATGEDPPRERTAVHDAKGSGSAKRKANIVASNSRAAAVPPRRTGGAVVAESREPEHRASTARRPRNQGEHLQVAKPVQVAKPGAVPVLDRSARRSAEQRRLERLHHSAGT